MSLASGSGANNWWERSCNPDNANNFVNCNTNGDPSNNNNATSTYGIVLGFFFVTTE
ncbi:MAG: hypothetical protein RR204_06670 [Raoultibacter sp.]